MSDFVGLYDRFLVVLAAIVAVMLVFATVIIVVEVTGRYFFNSPLGWALEVTEYILLYTTFLGMPWLVRRTQGHVRIDVMVTQFSQRTQAGLEMGVSLVVAVVCAVAAYYAVLTAWDHYVREVLTYGIYPIPKYWVIVPLAVSFVLCTIEFLRKARANLHQWRATESLDQEQTP